MKSVINIIVACVAKHQPIAALDVARIAGVDPLTAHRYLSGGRGKMTNGQFKRVKVNSKRIDPDGRVRGVYKYLYSINEIPKQTLKQVHKKLNVKRDPLIAAMYGKI